VVFLSGRKGLKMSKKLKTSTYRNGNYTTVTYYTGKKHTPHFNRELSFAERTGWTHWVEHTKLFAIIILTGVLFWQLNIAFPKVYAMIEDKLTVDYTFKIDQLVSPVPKATPLIDIKIPTPTPTPVPTPEPPAKDWDQFIEKVKLIARIYDYPVKVAAAQAAIESSHGNSKFAKERFNFFGIKAYDWNPDLASSYSSPEECIIEYMRLIKTSYPQAYAVRANPEQMIELIKAGGYATDPNYVWKVEHTQEWRSL
jgi:hypothetical protein